MTTQTKTFPSETSLEIAYPVYPTLWCQTLIGLAPKTTTDTGLATTYNEQLWFIPNLTKAFSQTIFGIYTYRREVVSIRLLSNNHHLTTTPGGKRKGVTLERASSEFFVPESWLFNLTITIDKGFPVFCAQSVASNTYSNGHKLTSLFRKK